MKGIIDPSLKRVIGSAGNVKNWDGEVSFPEPGSYKILFTLNNLDDSSDGIQPRLDKVARAMNLYGQSLVDLDDLSIVVLVSGPAVEMFNTQNYSYEKNQPVLIDLVNAGVSFMICSQALAGKGITKKALPAFVDVVLSAMITSVELQTLGYSVLTL
nr:DsrE family protein [uncultured Tolumonas sp.]